MKSDTQASTQAVLLLVATSGVKAWIRDKMVVSSPLVVAVSEGIQGEMFTCFSPCIQLLGYFDILIM